MIYHLAHLFVDDGTASTAVTMIYGPPLATALIMADAHLSTAPDELNPEQHLVLDDGKVIDLHKCLTLDDLFTPKFKLEQCRLVTLSACETGLIDFQNISDEYIGLPSGFRRKEGIRVKSAKL